LKRGKKGEWIVTGADDWNNQAWTYRAKQLIEWIAKTDKNRPLMLLIRHSHREVLRNHEDMLSGALTPIGKSVSREMGRMIPNNRKAHFFFSIVPRCYETAEAFSEGFIQAGGEVIDMDPLPTLVGPEYTDDSVWMNLNPNGDNVTEFVNRWASGEFEGRIEPFSQFQQRLIDDTLGRLVLLKENEVHIYVTHDLALMCAKRTLTDRALTEDDREPYLGGIAVAYIGSMLTLFTGGGIIPVRADLLQ
jgi:broad specificity phosphatase PhoE